MSKFEAMPLSKKVLLLMLIACLAVLMGLQLVLIIGAIIAAVLFIVAQPEVVLTSALIALVFSPFAHLVYKGMVALFGPPGVVPKKPQAT